MSNLKTTLADQLQPIPVMPVRLQTEKKIPMQGKIVIARRNLDWNHCPQEVEVF